MTTPIPILLAPDLDRIQAIACGEIINQLITPMEIVALCQTARQSISQAPAWIRCRGRRPEVGQRCLVWVPGINRCEDVTYRAEPCCWLSFRDDNVMWHPESVTHWQPLPKGPGVEA